MDNKPNISVFFPCFNDEHSIGKLVEDAFSVLKNGAQNFEVIVVNDGSKDRSEDVLRKLAQKYKNFRIVNHPKNLGYGKALTSGFKAAKYDWIFYTDGDGQYDVKEISKLIKLIDNDVDFINGIKSARSDPLFRAIIGNLYSFITRLLFWLPITDIDCDFRLIRKRITDKINFQSSNGAICIELVKKAQRLEARFLEISIPHYGRRWGRSQFFVPGRILRTLFLELPTLWLELMVFRKN